MREKQYRKKLKRRAEETRQIAYQEALQELQQAQGEPLRIAAHHANFLESESSKSNATSLPPRQLNATLQAIRQAIFFDTEKTLEARLAALHSGSLPLSTNKSVTLRTIRLIADPKQPIELRQATLQAFLGATFTTRSSAEWRPYYLEALRQVIRRSNDPMVETVLLLLVREGDDGAIEILKQGLRHPAQARLSPLQAIEALSMQDHEDHFDLLHKFARKNRSLRVREAAVRSLASDPSAQGLLEEIVRNRDEKTSLRQTALLSLRLLQPEQYKIQAISLLQDATEAPELRAACLTGLGIEDTRGSGDQVDLAKGLRETTISPILHQAAQRYLTSQER